jgi:hypothetical protein
MRLAVILGALLAMPVFSLAVHAETQTQTPTLSGDALISAPVVTQLLALPLFVIGRKAARA